MHHVLRAASIARLPAFPGHAQGFSRASLVDRSVGAVHTGLGSCRLEAGGRVDTHVQSFEEYFYITQGEPSLILDGRAYPLVPGSCGVVPVGTPHAWLGPERGEATWIDLLTPIHRGSGEPEDIFFTGPQLISMSSPSTSATRARAISSA